MNRMRLRDRSATAGCNVPIKCTLISIQDHSRGQAIGEGEVIDACPDPSRDVTFSWLRLVSRTEARDAPRSQTSTQTRADFCAALYAGWKGCFFLNKHLEHPSFLPSATAWEPSGMSHRPFPAPPSDPTNPAPLGLCNHKFFFESTSTFASSIRNITTKLPIFPSTTSEHQ